MNEDTTTSQPHNPHLLERKLHIPRALRLLAVTFAAVGAWAFAQDAPAIVELALVDAATGEAMRAVEQGETLSFEAGGDETLVLRAEPASEATGSVRFDIDGRPVHVDSEPPFELTLAPSGETFIVQDPEASATTLEIDIAASQGDAEEFLQPSEADAERYPAGYTYVQSSDLELGRDPDHAPQTIGLRFEGVAVPAGATIESAELLFDARGDSSGSLSLTIRGEGSTAEPYAQDADAAASAGLSQREATSASTPWELAEPWSGNQSYASPDVAGIVQEIVDRSEWQEGSAVNFLLEPAGGEAFRRAFAFDGSAQRAPTLRLTYTTEPEDSGIAWGEHRIEAVPYTEPGATGAAGATLGASVSIARDQEPAAADAPAADPADAAEADAVEADVVEADAADPADAAEADPAAADPAPPEPTPADAGAADEGDRGGDAEHVDTPADADVAPAGPDAAADPAEPAEAEPVDAEPPVEGPSASVLRRERYPLVALDGGRSMGATLVSAYADGSSVITVTLDGVAAERYAIELWRGRCEQPRELVAPLQPHRPAIGSVTPVAVGFSTLVLGNLSVLVMSEPGAAAVACSQLGGGM